jgi:hypothetical protein
VPREVHETYATNPDDPDGEGIRTGYVVVARESEWDDTTRARALALVEYEEGLCSCGCGLPREQAYLKQPFMVHKVTCYADKAIQSRRRADRELHEKDKPGWDDGLHYVAVPAKPTDIPEARRT